MGPSNLAEQYSRLEDLDHNEFHDHNELTVIVNTSLPSKLVLYPVKLLIIFSWLQNNVTITIT